MSLDKQLIRSRFAKHFAGYHENAVVQKGMAEQLADMIEEAAAADPVGRGLEVGVGTGFLSARLLAAYPAATWFFNDLAPEAFGWVQAAAPSGSKLSFVAGDAETVPFPGELDLLASASAMQWFDDARAFIEKARNAIRPGGLLALGTFGPDNMRELRELTGRGLHYRTLPELGSLLESAGWSLLSTREWREHLVFPDAIALLKHVRETGVNAIAPGFRTPRQMKLFCETYTHRFGWESEGVVLTYHPILVVGRNNR